VINFWRLID